MVEQLGIGDSVEILFTHLDNRTISKVWIPAMVTYVDEHRLYVCFSGGERFVLPLRDGGEKRWRRAEK